MYLVGTKKANLEPLLKALPGALSSYSGRRQFSAQEQQKVCTPGKSHSSPGGLQKHGSVVWAMTEPTRYDQP